MAAPVIRRALEVPGRLSWGCTNIATAYPHGGTALGFVGKTAVRMHSTYQEITDESHGNEVQEVVMCGENIGLACVLRDEDDDALAEVYLNTTAGTATGHNVVDIGGTNRTGAKLSARADVLVFTPEAVISGDDNIHRMVVLFKAVPRVEAEQELAERLGVKLEHVCVFTGLRDASGRLGKLGFRDDLSI